MVKFLSNGVHVALTFGTVTMKVTNKVIPNSFSCLFKAFIVEKDYHCPSNVTRRNTKNLLE